MLHNYEFNKSSTFSGGRPKTARSPFTTIGRSMSLGFSDIFRNIKCSSSKWGCKLSSLNTASLVRIKSRAFTPIFIARDCNSSTEGGLFKSVENGYYLGGGTGTADALKLGGNLVPLDTAKSWLLKSWEMVNQDQVALERFASAGGIQSIYSEYSGISIVSLTTEAIYPDVILERATQKEEPALKTFADVSLNLAELLFERIETIFSGWSGRFGLINTNRETPSSEHSFLGTILDRIIIGQRLGDLLESSKGSEKFWEPLVCQLENLISKSDKLDSTAKSAYVINDKLNPDLIRISTLRDAPVLGAGIDAALYNKEDQT